MPSCIEFYGDAFGRDVISADSPKIEGIEGNRPLRVGESRVRTGLSGFFFMLCLV